MQPFTKKRNRNLESSDSPGNFAKRITTDGGIRGLGSTSGSSSPAAAPGTMATMTRTRRAGNSITTSTSQGREIRQREFNNGMAQLNYQLYSWAKSQRGGTIPDDAFYDGIVENYHLQASDLHRRFNRQYGDITVFGSGDCGQLGCGEAVTDARRPKILMGLRGNPINMLASGGLHTLALQDDGKVYSWGCNDEGSLGWLAGEENDDGALPSVITGFHPSQYGPNGVTKDLLDANGAIIPFEKRKEAIITQVAAGETQSLALSSKGDVYFWGANKDNEGRGFRNMPPADDKRILTGNKDMDKLEDDDNPEYFKPPRGNQDWPLHLTEFTKRAKDISAGGSFNAALLEDDTLVTWGVGECGELARPVPTLSKKTPMEVIKSKYLRPQEPIWEQPTIKRAVVNMSCGGYHILVMSRERGGIHVYSSGLNQYGQLGLEDKLSKKELTKIQYFEREGIEIRKIEGGLQFSCFVDKTGKELYTCGRGDYGQLGNTLEQPDAGYGDAIPHRTPIIYKTKGMADNPKEYSIKAEDIIEEDQPEIEQVSCGSTHVLVLTKGGDAYSWGYGTMGACGQGKEDGDVLQPKKLEAKLNNAQGGPTKFKVQYVSGGGQHSTAIVETSSTGFAS